MSLEILRRKRPESVRQEIWTGLLAYHLVRPSLLQSALATAIPQINATSKRALSACAPPPPLPLPLSSHSPNRTATRPPILVITDHAR